jgi:hypothetical protein
MTYEELVKATGVLVGIEGFAPDEDGVCYLVSDIGEIAIIQCREPVECVVLNAPVMVVPDGASATMLAALEANKGFRETKGATLSVDTETNRFELSQYALLEDLSAESFVAMIEDFATTLVNLREKLEAAQSQSGGGEALEEAVSQFMRV